MKYNLPTSNGKVIKLTSASIAISTNNKIASGYFIDLKLVGVLPGCRKPEILTYSFSTVGEVSFTTLFNYRKHHDVKYEDIKKLIEIVPVIPYIINPPTITPELEKFAREDRIAMYGRKG